ncbi:putative DEAD/DEAH box DNA helicase (Mer3) [Aspergillus lucknowensis]|uniref:DNA 3'-5' helicase n=1 Tax=Aspergillus lucknowensis TaxID=176173 RepID=A0ABR4LZC1_9EURO
MRRRVDRPFSIPRQGIGPPWKRTVDRQHSSSSQGHSNNLIDERLIEGAQVSSFSSKPYRQDSQSYYTDTPLGPSRHPGYEDDMRLDAFDLELLAQSDVTARSFQPSSNTESFSTYQPRQRDPPKQISRFFNDSQVTPQRSTASSSSDIDVREVSSPLARLQPGRATRPLRGPDYDTTRITQNSQSYFMGPGASPVQSNAESLAPYESGTPFRNIPVSIRGIVLLSVRELPDNYRSLFQFPVFNAVQSKCFQTVYKSDDNIVLAAPTGTGKTVVMELAICRLLNTLKDERFKVVYQAPTKSLCSERFRDWNRKFNALGLQCAELTGDTDHSQLRNVQNSQIIITTPEKWDSMTRKWKDHVRLMQLVKLFLIDEVHTLKEARGATLEAVVSRMKTFGSNIRFVALSATIPNSEDIATWLGRNATSQHVPAYREHFGEEFRPVKLQKFVYGYQAHSNDFAFDKLCNSKLPDIIATHSAKKPIIIFCCTRNSTVTTAKELARLWSMSNAPARLWKGPNRAIPVTNMDLKTTTTAGVAFHHAGLEPSDRHQVETGFLEGKISIICCTSTLAVGVNLPCHLVIIKNTVGWQDGRSQEYSDLEIMQMLGRAGRPQFDDSAAAVILTRKERVNHYEKLVSGSESLESCLHLNLIDHLNAEIGLGNVTGIDSAISWLAGTFLFVRLRRNPTHYKLKEGANREDEDEMLRQICEKDIKLLQECDLVTCEGLKATPFGDAMARYCVRFETMRKFLSLKPRSDIGQILSVISQAEEFRDVRLKSGEKSLYKEINRASDISYPINVDIALPAHKISLLIQSELGAVEFPSNEQLQKQKFPFQQDKNFVFTHVNRLIRCIIDCQVHLQDSVTLRNALELARSLTAKVWDNSPLQMKQIEQIGAVAVRKLAASGIESIAALEETEPHQAEMVLSRNPPFGVKLRSRLADFPKLRVSVKMVGKDVKPDHIVRARFKAEIAFMNEKCPVFFQRRPVYVCFVAETSEGHLIDFRRISASKLQKSHEIMLSADLKSQEQYITCYVMCDEIAGTARYATLKPDISQSYFPRQPASKRAVQEILVEENVMAGKASQANPPRKRTLSRFNSDDILFGEFLEAEILDDWNESSVSGNPPESSMSAMAHIVALEKEDIAPGTTTKETLVVDKEPSKLDNGRWACNHKCKDKSTCKHLCCREGLSNPPKVTRRRSDVAPQEPAGLNQLTLSASMLKRDSQPTVVAGSVVQVKKGKDENEHSNSGQIQRPRRRGFKATGNDHLISDSSTDYGDENFDDLPSPTELLFGNVHTINSDSQRAFDVTHADQGLREHGDGWIDADEVLFPAHSPLSKPYVRTNGFTETCLVDLVSPEPQEMISMLPQSGGCGGQKRKMSVASGSGVCGEDNKRAKSCETAQNSHITSRNKNMDAVVVERREIGTENQTAVQGSAISSIPIDWEDIDPALLNEFKDIVDFF